jgi:hypothetical protein
MIKKGDDLEKVINRRRGLEYVFELRYEIASLRSGEIFNSFIHKFFLSNCNI